MGQVVGDRGMGHPTAPGNLTVGQTDLVLEAQDLFDLAHGEPFSGHNPPFLLYYQRKRDAAGLPRRRYALRAESAAPKTVENRGNFRPKRLATFRRNDWQLSTETGGNFAPKYAVRTQATQSVIG